MREEYAAAKSDAEPIQFDKSNILLLGPTGSGAFHWRHLLATQRVLIRAWGE